MEIVGFGVGLEYQTSRKVVHGGSMPEEDYLLWDNGNAVLWDDNSYVLTEESE